VVATLSPKGGCGKTTSTFLAGSVLAGHLRLRALAVDLNPDFGTLADLAPDRAAVARRAAARQGRHRLARGAAPLRLPAAQRPAPARRASRPGPHGPDDPELYGELLAFLRRFYEVILLDLGTGVTAPIATFAVERADQVVVVTTPEWITNTKVQMALGHLRLEHATLVLNKIDRRAAWPPPSASSAASDSPSALPCRPTCSSRRCSTPERSRYPGSLSGLARSTRVPIKRLGLAVASQLA
jgi:hypothetical protein